MDMQQAINILRKRIPNPDKEVVDALLWLATTTCGGESYQPEDLVRMRLKYVPKDDSQVSRVAVCRILREISESLYGTRISLAKAKVLSDAAIASRGMGKVVFDEIDRHLASVQVANFEKSHCHGFELVLEDCYSC